MLVANDGRTLHILSKIAVVVAVLVFALVFVGLVRQPFIAQASTAITTSRTFYTTTNDGYAEGFDYNYTIAHGSTTGYPFPTGNIMLVGRANDTGLYHITRTFLYFDTSAIPNNATFLNYTLSLFIYYEVNDTQFNLVLQKGITDIFPHEPPISTDYYFNNYNGGESGINSTAIVTSAYNNMTGTNSSLINFGGETKLALRNSNDVNNSAPAVSGWEWLQIYTKESGYGPMLTVFYETTGYSYILHGPYYDDGTVANAKVNVTLLIENSPSNVTTIDGTDGSADTVIYLIEQRGTAFVWNISISYNYTRIHYLTSASFEELYIFIPKPDDIINLYTFEFVDMVGITNAYMETRTTLNGIDQTVERQSLNLISGVPYWLAQNRRYGLKLLCDQGTYILPDFIPGSDLTQYIAIKPDMFPSSSNASHISVSAVRNNATWIRISYYDNDSLTYWVNVAITYNGATAYQTNNTGFVQTIDWYAADNETSYQVNVTSLYGTKIKHWIFQLPHPPISTNPWEDAFAALGTFIFPLKWLLGVIIIMCVFGAFTYAYMPAGCFAGVITAGLLMWIGWWDAPTGVAGIALALVTTTLYALAQAKREEREV